MTSETLEVHHVRFFEYQPLPINCIACDSTSYRVAVSRSDGSVQILSTADNWTQVLNFPGGANSSVEALVWSQQRLFAAGLGGNVVELDLDSQLVKDSVSSNAGPVWCLAGNEEETRLAAGTEDGCVVLFNIENELQFLRVFGKQEGRILSVAWYSNGEGENQENIIVTGGANNIRQWSVNSGQPISRMTVGSSNNKDTIVWCVAVTKDFTIISGDSRGVVTFWNGKLSTQMKSFHCHKADVLSLCLSHDETTVYSGGVDSTVYYFCRYAPDANSERMRWAHQLLHGYHTHDVRALAYTTDGCVVSGGVDCVLQVADLKQDVKRVRDVMPIPTGVLVNVDKEHNLILLQYKNYIELWRLGAAESPEKTVRGIIPLTQNPVKLIQLKARDGQEISCNALSSDGQLAFSDLQQVRLYRFNLDETASSTPQLRLERVKHSFAHPARLMTFTASGDRLVAVLVGSGMDVMDCKTGAILHRFKTDSPIHILTASPDNCHIAYATVNHKVSIADVDSGQVVCQCPVVSSQVSAFSFSPHSPTLVIVYGNHKIYEMDISKREYSSWCRQHSQDIPSHWMNYLKNVRNVVFNPDQPDMIYLYTAHCLAALDKTEMGSDHINKVVRKCFKYKFLLHADFLKDGKMVVVERPPSMIDEQLPPSLKQKKFGIA